MDTAVESLKSPIAKKPESPEATTMDEPLQAEVLADPEGCGHSTDTGVYEGHEPSPKKRDKKKVKSSKQSNVKSPKKESQRDVDIRSLKVVITDAIKVKQNDITNDKKQRQNDKHLVPILGLLQAVQTLIPSLMKKMSPSLTTKGVVDTLLQTSMILENQSLAAAKHYQLHSTTTPNEVRALLMQKYYTDDNGILHMQQPRLSEKEHNQKSKAIAAALLSIETNLDLSADADCLTVYVPLIEAIQLTSSELPIDDNTSWEQANHYKWEIEKKKTIIADLKQNTSETLGNHLPKYIEQEENALTFLKDQLDALIDSMKKEYARYIGLRDEKEQLPPSKKRKRSSTKRDDETNASDDDSSTSA